MQPAAWGWAKKEALCRCHWEGFPHVLQRLHCLDVSTSLASIYPVPSCSCGNTPLRCLPGLRKLDRQMSSHTVPSSGSGWGSREFCIFSGAHRSPCRHLPSSGAPTNSNGWSTRGDALLFTWTKSYRLGEVRGHSLRSIFLGTLEVMSY